MLILKIINRKIYINTYMYKKTPKLPIVIVHYYTAFLNENR